MDAVMERTQERKRAGAVATGTLPTLPSNFTGFSIDAQNGLQLWNNGVLQARYGSGGGAGVLKEHSGFQAVDATHNARLRFEYPAGAVNAILQVLLSFTLQPFRSGQQSTSAAGSSHSHTFSGTSTAGSSHTHIETFYGAKNLRADSGTLHYGSAGTGTAPGAYVAPDLLSGDQLASGPSTQGDSPAHTHDLSGVTSNSESSHTHNLNAPTGLYEAGMAQGVHVYVDGTDRTTALGGPWGTGSTLDVSDLDVTAWLTTTGWHTVELTSTTIGGAIFQVLSKCLLKTV